MTTQKPAFHDLRVGGLIRPAVEKFGGAWLASHSRWPRACDSTSKTYRLLGTESSHIVGVAPQVFSAFSWSSRCILVERRAGFQSPFRAPSVDRVFQTVARHQSLSILAYRATPRRAAPTKMTERRMILIRTTATSSKRVN